MRIRSTSILAIFSIATLCLSPSIAFARTMDLKEAIAYALTHNPQLKNAHLDKTVRIHELKVLKQKFSPQLSLNMSVTAQNEDYFNEDFVEKKIHTYPSLRFLTPLGTQVEVFTEQNLGYEQYQRKSGAAVHITFEQPLLKGRNSVVNRWSIENGVALNEIQELMLTQASNQVIYNVILRYHALMLAGDNIASQERWLSSAQRFYESLKMKVDVGRAPSSDLTSSMLQLSQAKSYIAQAQFSQHQALREFKEIIGYDEADELSIIPVAFSPQHVLNKKAIIQKVMDNDIETKILNLNKSRLKTQMIVAKDQQLFDLRFKGDFTVGRYHIYGNDTPSLSPYDSSVYNAPFVHNSGNYSAHLLMSIPLTGKDQRKHYAYATKVEQQKNEFDFTTHHKHLISHTTGLIEKLQLQKQQLGLSRQQLSLAQKNYDDALMKLEAGRTSMFEVTSLREKLHDVQMKLNSAEIAYLDIVAQVDFACGVLGQKWLS